MANLICLHGWARSGKDTAAAFLKPLGFEVRAFADPLRSLTHACDPIIAGYFGDEESVWYRYAEALDDIGYNEAKLAYPEVREFLQRLGNGARQVFGDLFWVEQALKGLEDPESRVVWTDCRYNNEGQAVRDAGGLIVKIERRGTGPANAFEAEHHSMPGFEFDRVIENNGSLEDLRAKIEDIFKYA